MSRSNRASPQPIDKIQNHNRSFTVRGNYLPSLFSSISPFRDEESQLASIQLQSRTNHVKNNREKETSQATLKLSLYSRGYQCNCNGQTAKIKQSWGQKDLEEVQQELLIFKQQYNSVKEENRLLHTRLRNWEISLIDTINDEHLQNNPQQDVQRLHTKMSQLMNVYKRLQEKNNLTQKQLQAALDEITQLKQNSRVSRYEQIEIELKKANEECERLLIIASKLINIRSETKFQFKSSQDLKDFSITKLCDAQDLLVILNSEMQKFDEVKAQYEQKINSLNKRLNQLRFVYNQALQQKANLQIKLDESQIMIKELSQTKQIKAKRKESLSCDASQIISDQQFQLQKLQQDVNLLREANSKLEKQMLDQLKNNSLQSSVQLPQANKMAKVIEQLTLDKQFNKFLLNQQQSLELLQSLEIPCKGVEDSKPDQQEQDPTRSPVSLKRQFTISSDKVNQVQLLPKTSNNEEDIEQNQESEIKSSPPQRLSSRFLEDHIALKQIQNIRLSKVTASNTPKAKEMNVMQIVKGLKNQFMISSIEYGKLDSLFYIEKIEELSIKQLFNMFEKEPFMMTSTDDRIILARYLVEDNTKDYVIFNQDETANINIIKSVFKKLIGPYKLFDEKEEQQVHIELATNLHKVNLQFNSSMAMITVDQKQYKKNECELEDFYQALKLFDITLSLRQNDYLNLLIFKQNQNLGRFNYRTLLDNLEVKYNENIQKKN